MDIFPVSVAVLLLLLLLLLFRKFPFAGFMRQVLGEESFGTLTCNTKLNIKYALVLKTTISKYHHDKTEHKMFKPINFKILEKGHKLTPSRIKIYSYTPKIYVFLKRFCFQCFFSVLLPLLSKKWTAHKFC